MRSTVRTFFLSILVLTLPCMLNAQAKKGSTPSQATAPDKVDPLQGSPKIVTATRGVQQFWDIEKSLAQAFDKKDQSALGKMLNEDFKIWMPNQTGSAIGREDWLAAGKENPSPVRLAQMAVQFYQDVVVVKFLGQGKHPTSGKGNAHQYFVVDLWEKNDTGWELTNRYMSAITPVEMPKRPTGKE
jgi:Domain of unknown function (DUF4440)